MKEVMIDTETREVIAKDVWEAFKDILTRLERIEKSIGEILEPSASS